MRTSAYWLNLTASSSPIGKRRRTTDISLSHGSGGTGSKGTATTIDGGHVTVLSHVWKEGESNGQLKKRFIFLKLMNCCTYSFPVYK